MLGRERGTCSGSDLYFQTPSETARKMLYFMTSCGYYYTNYDYHIQRENYHSYMIAYIIDGRLSVKSQQRTMVASSGQVIFLNCYIPHEYHTIGNTEFIWLHLDGVNVADIQHQVMQQQGGFVFDTPCAKEIEKRIYEIISACRNEQLPNETHLSLQLYGILTTVLDSSSKQAETTQTSSAVDEALQFIKDHYGEPISLPDVAQHVSMSQYHFSRLFKKECGYSPHEFLILTRLNCAKHLLKTTEQPIKVIAQTVGYQNVTTFTNAFSSRVGLSPSQFRKYPV